MRRNHNLISEFMFEYKQKAYSGQAKNDPRRDRVSEYINRPKG